MEHSLTPLVTNLPTLKLLRCRLEDTGRRSARLQVNAGEEVLIYPLIGAAYVSLDGSVEVLHAGRSSVLDTLSAVLRCKPDRQTCLDITLNSEQLDCLIAIAVRKDSRRDTHAYPTPTDGPSGTITSQHVGVRHHTVGAGTHERRVTEFETPLGFVINAGETLNVPGGWSSWPAHATKEVARKKCTDHEEIFFVVTPGTGYMFFDGWFADGCKAYGMIEAKNGQALITPLGSHPIVFTPGHWGYYAWFYVSTAITKTYNKWAHERGLKTYVE